MEDEAVKTNGEQLCLNKSEKKWRGAVVFLFSLTYVLYDELLFTVGLDTGMTVYKLLLALSFGALLFFTGCLPENKKIGFYLQASVAMVINTFYISQFVYWDIFATPYFVNSLSGTGAAMEFFSVAFNSFTGNWPVTMFFCFQIVMVFTLYRMLFYTWEKPRHIKKKSFLVWFVLFFCGIGFPLAFAPGANQAGYYMLYEHVAVPSAKTLGILPSMITDVKFNVFDIKMEYPDTLTIEVAEDETEIPPEEKEQGDIGVPDAAEGEISDEEHVKEYPGNVMDIAFNFDETDGTLLSMNEYFSAREPTSQNGYTGMFSGKNLILITAEGFSGALIDPEITPTLYKLSTEGFVFENFYTPIWNVSTSDGEYVATTGLLPKTGVWSYTEIAGNYMPFAFGNQFNALGYTSYAFHNHTYTYYNRDKSYPAMGYEYFAKGSGLDVEDVWPESDVEMMEESAPVYMQEDSFNVYYLTVSGHLEYNFYGNTMAYRHRDEVEAMELEYSEAVQAYIACQLELEYALRELLAYLEEADRLDDTVIALSADHYPYGLTNEEYAELMGVKELDTTFQIYENDFLLWSPSVKEPVIIDKYCSSLDIAPTLSNLFGLEYDSRLFMGRDILSDDYKGFVVFADRSFITDKVMYDANTREVTMLTDEAVSDGYISRVSAEVRRMFEYSADIIDTDYYSYLLSE